MKIEQIESELVISITELRRHFGKYLHLVIEGRTIIVTKYGEKIVKLEPINAPVHHGKNNDVEVFEPEKSYTILTHNVYAILNYAKSTGKRVSELTQEEIDQFKLEKRN